MEWTPIWYQADSKLFMFTSLRNRTVVFDVPVYSDGERIRVTFINEYGKNAYRVGGMRILYGDKTLKVTKNGMESFEIPTGGRCYSDVIECPVKAGNTVQVRIFMRSNCVDSNMIEEWAMSYKGNVLDQKDLPPEKKSDFREKNGLYHAVPVVEAIEVERDEPVKVIAAFGDSITAMNRWVKPLQKRLYEAYGQEYTLVNAGISGNCLIYEKPGKLWRMFGEMGIRRVQRDVYDLKNLDTVIFGLGTNDISYGDDKRKDLVSAEKVIAPTDKIIKELHRRGVRVAVQTISPRFGYFGKPEYNDYMNNQRLIFNDWVRNNQEIDYVFDADAVVRDPKKPDWYDDRYHQGDYLHPNAEGGRVLAEAFDLRKLTGGQI